MNISSNNNTVNQLPHQILTGTTWHARHLPSKHTFSYPYRYWGLNLNRLADGDFPQSIGLFSKSKTQKVKLFTAQGRGLHSFYFTDYFEIDSLDETNPTNAQYKKEHLIKQSEQPQPIKTNNKADSKPNKTNQKLKAEAWLNRIQQEFQRLTNSQPTGDILALVVSRNLGVYFSPVNFYLGFDSYGQASHLLAEVSNTPWNKSHFYAFKLDGSERKSDTGKANKWEFSHNKDFHVSPFNPIDQIYTWKVQLQEVVYSTPNLSKNNGKSVAIDETHVSGLQKIKLSIHVSDTRGKVFEAGINMQPQAMTEVTLRQTIRRIPLMNYSSMLRIYWHAILLYVIKKVPYVVYNQKLKASKQNDSKTDKSDKGNKSDKKKAK